MWELIRNVSPLIVPVHFDAAGFKGHIRRLTSGRISVTHPPHGFGLASAFLPPHLFFLDVHCGHEKLLRETFVKDPSEAAGKDARAIVPCQPHSAHNNDECR